MAVDRDPEVSRSCQGNPTAAGRVGFLACSHLCHSSCGVVGRGPWPPMARFSNGSGISGEKWDSFLVIHVFQVNLSFWMTYSMP